MKKAILVLALMLFAVAAQAQGQTFNLENNSCAQQASSYLLCQDMQTNAGPIIINGVPYLLDTAIQVNNIYQNPASGTVLSAPTELQNLNTDQYVSFTNVTATYINRHFSESFTVGSSTGTLDFDVVVFKGYRGRLYWSATNIVLVINQ